MEVEKSSIIKENIKLYLFYLSDKSLSHFIEIGTHLLQNHIWLITKKIIGSLL